MKKICCVIICLAICLSLAGCNKKSSGVTAVTAGLSFTAEINYEKNEIICDGAIDKEGKAVFTVISPKEIAGLTYNMSGDTAEISFKEISYPIEKSNSHVLNIVGDILKTAEKNKENVVLSDDVFSLSGNTHFGELKLTVGESGLPISAEIPDIGLTVYFKNTAIK